MRGAEGDYARWPRGAGGPYDGFLLSTANGFARELHSVLADSNLGRIRQARAEADRLSRTVAEVFRIVTGLPQGNAFANANKAVDHFVAHGERAGKATPPRLHGGSVLTPAVLDATRDVLLHHGFLPRRGYLEVA